MDSKSLKLAKQFIGTKVIVTVGRKLGSKHPKYNFIYPINYGYIKGISAPDGDFLDAYILGVDIPMSEFSGKCIAVIHRKNDDDDKLVVVCEDSAELSDDEITNAVTFQEQWFDSVVVRK